MLLRYYNSGVRNYICLISAITIIDFVVVAVEIDFDSKYAACLL